MLSEVQSRLQKRIDCIDFVVFPMEQLLVVSTFSVRSFAFSVRFVINGDLMFINMVIYTYIILNQDLGSQVWVIDLQQKKFGLSLVLESATSIYLFF